MVTLSSADEVGFAMDNFGGNTFFVNAHWSTAQNAWLLDDGTPASQLDPLNPPDGSSTEKCLVMMNGQLTAASCDDAYQFICENTGTPGAEDEDDEAARDEGFDICDEPMDIECRNVRTGDVLENGETSDGLSCTLEHGAQCSYDCENYEVRYRCCHVMPQCTTTVAPTTAAPPTTTAAPPTTTAAPPTTTAAPPTTTAAPPTTTAAPPTTTAAPPTTTAAPPTTTAAPPTTSTTHNNM
ncbi:mucin-2-like [Branchiostoma floridae]|uniref:Mucin-2-like n=1 Tax=Branchiostoma floridae TaxID=7739 RepID=A0A9J7HII9_BRAFL|nr:mucin-2-like [Branchiostoma floridae]